MKESFRDMLLGPTNTSGRSLEVYEAVKSDPTRSDEVFELYFQPDEWVRLRSSNVLRRLWREDTNWVKPYIARWVEEVSIIDQPSVHWTFAQLTGECSEWFTSEQLNTAIERVKIYLENSDDWIVLNTSIETLAYHAASDKKLRKWLLPRLEEFTKHGKKSVATRAGKKLKVL